MNDDRNWLLNLSKHGVVSIILLGLFVLFLYGGGVISQFIVYMIGCWAVGTKIPNVADWVVDKLNKRAE